MADQTEPTIHFPTSRWRGPLLVLPLALGAWVFLVLMVMDMDHPLSLLTMPGGWRWSASNSFAIWTMWAVMMIAMMLPSAYPMIRTFVALSARGGEHERGWTFVAAYLAVWLLFSVGATLAQWSLQALGWVDAMMVSRSPLLTASLLVIAGVYQFSPLKRRCLFRCQSPLGFLLGEWRSGAYGAWIMGLRHGLDCVGCCWAMMALLFVGGAMNLPWVVALSVAVAMEKWVPHAKRLTSALGLLLMGAGLLKLLDSLIV